ncbi:MAG: sugar ABC transporter permease [Coprococcus sp.]|nr:sugar ABC transporter permease [Coprococcus sp.]
MRKKHRSAAAGKEKYLFVLPLVIFILVMAIYPIGYIAKLSFYEWSLALGQSPKWAGMENYVYALTSQSFWHSVWITLIYAVVSVLVEVVLGVCLALLLAKNFKAKNLVKTGFILPMVATPVAIALTWRLMYDVNYGIINYLLGKLGLQFMGISSAETALISFIMVDIWQWTPFIMLMVSAGIASLPTDPYEAAMLDGATKGQILGRITLPLLNPTILTATLLRLIDALKSFDIIYATTKGGPGDSSKTLNILVYEEAFSNFRFGRVSAYVVLFVVFILLVCGVFMKIKKRVEVDF